MSCEGVQCDVIPPSYHSRFPPFQIPQRQLLRPFTDCAVRQHLKSVSTLLDLSRSLTVHYFHRGGAYWTFFRGFPFRKFRPKVPGHQNVFGATSRFPLPIHHRSPMRLDLTSLPSLFPLPTSTRCLRPCNFLY